MSDEVFFDTNIIAYAFLTEVTRGRGNRVRGLLDWAFRATSPPVSPTKYWASSFWSLRKRSGGRCRRRWRGPESGASWTRRDGRTGLQPLHREKGTRRRWNHQRLLLGRPHRSDDEGLGSYQALHRKRDRLQEDSMGRGPQPLEISHPRQVRGGAAMSDTTIAQPAAEASRRVQSPRICS